MRYRCKSVRGDAEIIHKFVITSAFTRGRYDSWIVAFLEVQKVLGRVQLRTWECEKYKGDKNLNDWRLIILGSQAELSRDVRIPRDHLAPHPKRQSRQFGWATILILLHSTYNRVHGVLSGIC